MSSQFSFTLSQIVAGKTNQIVVFDSIFVPRNTIVLTNPQGQTDSPRDIIGVSGFTLTIAGAFGISAPGKTQSKVQKVQKPSPALTAGKLGGWVYTNVKGVKAAALSVGVQEGHHWAWDGGSFGATIQKNGVPLPGVGVKLAPGVWAGALIISASGLHTGDSLLVYMTGVANFTENHDHVGGTFSTSGVTSPAFVVPA